MLNLFSDRRFLPPNTAHFPLLYPFWGGVSGEVCPPDEGMFESYIQEAPQFLHLTSWEDADAAVMPNQWITGNANREGRRLGEDARQRGKPLLVFSHADISESVNIEGSLVFHASLYRSARKRNDFVLPAFSTDFTR